MLYKFSIQQLRYLVCFIAGMGLNNVHAQTSKAEQLLLQKYELAETVPEKVYSLFPLINFYYAFNYERRADSLRDMQIITAEESRNETLILSVLFPVYDNSVTQNSSNRRFQKELGFANQALEYAKSLNKNDYVALAFSTIAGVYRNSGQPNLALKNADIAFTTAISSGNDSVKIVTALELGNVFMQKKDLLMAYRKFSNADDIANTLDNPYLLSAVYNHFSYLYVILKKNEKAKEYLLNSIALNKQAGNTKGLVKDYIKISTTILDFVPARNYLQRAMLLAESMHDPVLKLQINQIQFVQHMINDNSENTFKFLRSHPDVEMALQGPGEHKYEWVIGEIFLYSKMYDSALVHLKRAEPAFDINYNVSGRINFFHELADCYRGLKLYHEAIQYYTTTLQLVNVTLNAVQKSYFLDALQQLYYQTGNFQKAYEYSNYFKLFQDSINNLNKDRDLVLLEIDNKNKRIQKEIEMAEKARERRHYAQYMIITITVAAAFIILVLLGLFKVSATTIRVLGFLSFIFLFELIILLLDTWIHGLTHGEPWKIWVIKIVIISMMLPFHSWTEHKLINYLLNKERIHIGNFFSFRKLFERSKKQTAPVEETTVAVELPEEVKAKE